MDEKWWGFINGAYFLGLIVGSIYCIKFSPFIEKKLGTFIFVGSFASFIVTLNAIGTGIFGIGSLIMGMLADLLGVQMVFLISGLLLAIVSTIVYKNKSLFVRNTMKQ